MKTVQPIELILVSTNRVLIASYDSMINYKVLDYSYKVQSPKSFSLKDLKVPTHLFCFSQ